jgi:SpoIVB peptidase S55
MPCRTLVPAIVLAALSVLGASASSGRMPVDEIRPGMVGVGRTVFEADRIEEFKVHFVGVLRNVLGPSRNLILAKLEGGPLASTGVIAGMSGSPVYVDGRIVGAVSYSLGAFSKEPIAGITPIDEMIEAAARTEGRPPLLRAQLELPVTQASLAEALRRSFVGNRPFAESPADVQVLSAASAARWPTCWPVPSAMLASRP